MICYAIKNKDKYYRNCKNHWTTDIRKCVLWEEEYKAYWFLSSIGGYVFFPNSKVVKVEIKEIEDGEIN